MPIIAILDANVIYPAPLRDLLLNLADLDLFIPKWSKIIQEEWIRNLLKRRIDLEENRLSRTATMMNKVFPTWVRDAFWKRFYGVDKVEAQWKQTKKS